MQVCRFAPLPRQPRAASLRSALMLRGWGSMIRLFGAMALVVMSTLVAAAEPYDYPYSNPYYATVVGTPQDKKAKVPEKIPLKIRHLPQFEGRKIPDALWYGARL